MSAPPATLPPDAAHRQWLRDQARALLTFHRTSADRQHGGFGELDLSGRPQPAARPLFVTARMTYGYALGTLLGSGDVDLVEHGLAALRGNFHDDRHGGWVDTLAADSGDVLDARKATYGHAFVLLAAATANQAGFDAADLFEEAADLLATRFFMAADGLCLDSRGPDWSDDDPYRGVNANMHAVEALLAQFDADRDRAALDRAASITAHVVGFARANGWRIPEHFDRDWHPQLEYHRDRPADRFRPYGATPGHAFEWARLILRIDAAGTDDDLVAAARALFDRAAADAWDEARAGFAYTTDWSGRPVVDTRLHWPLTEAIGAAYTLWSRTGDQSYADWYRRLWTLADRTWIDHHHGGWFHELDDQGRPGTTIWPGKSDMYHALQACLLPLAPGNVGLAGHLAAAPL